MVELHRKGSAPAACAAGLFQHLLYVKPSLLPLSYEMLAHYVINRPGVAGAVLHTASLLLN